MPRARAHALIASLALATIAACGGDDAPVDGEDAGSGRVDAGDTSPDSTTPPAGCNLDDCAVDTDGDGLSDCEEGDANNDGDAFPDCNDDDSDGDGISDADEGSADSDDDGTPDRVDDDSDGDGIRDEFEGDADPDEDGLPARVDDDSDGDGVPDALEYGRRADDGGPPLDRDSDGTPDFLDLDADGDGVGDAEELGCPESTDRVRYDTDGDGISDLLERTFGSDPCDPDSDLEGIVDFFFVLPFDGPGDDGSLDFGTDLDRADIAFNIDTTGSMSGQIEALKDSLSSLIIPGVDAELSDPAFSVSHFDDFPCGDFGSDPDRPFFLLQRVTTDAAAAQAAVDRIPLHNGGDGPESGIESLYQIATGAGTDDCRPGLVPPFDGARNLVAGVAEGLLGGVGFRRGAVPLAVHITDATSHSRDGGYPYGASRADAFDALRATGVRVIGVSSSSGARTDLEQFAAETGAVVPVCAFDGGRPAGCAAGECCTGVRGAGRPAAGGECPLVFDVQLDGTGLGPSIVEGIAALANFSPVDITTRVRPDPDELARSGVDTACFITAVRPDVALPRPGPCSSTPTRADFDGDGEDDGFEGVTPGSTVFFTVDAFNDCVRGAPTPQTFIAWIDVVAGGDAVLDSRLVTIVVPPDLKD